MVSDKAILGEGVEIHPLALIEDGARLGNNTKVGPFCIIRKNAVIGEDCNLTAYCEMRENVVVGDRTTFGSRCTISANARIGNDVRIKYAFVLTDTPELEQDSNKVVGHIGNDVLIGANVTLMPGFQIGDGAVIGACSQVRNDVGPNEIWFGNPAKFFKTKG
ncbi:MAG: transferase [Porticoccus sp.]|jgi:UDP-2-acetamido-3-amino-2,3-dideoxy-glucuronate N-acetyltransferase|nr:MAG: transferase [Porticoccus sp.]